jgi:TetR/AcrR family acrAB operon transcriptional repressor
LVDARRHALAKAARKAGRGGGRDRILAAATDLFGSKGFSDVSMQDVAKAAGVTKAALYYHFTDKVDLYTTVALQRIDLLYQAMDEAVGEGSLEERLVRLAMVGFERIQADVYGPHLHAHGHLDEEHHQQLHRAMDRLQEPVIRCFEESGPPDPALSPRAASELLSGILFSLIFAPDETSAGGSDLPTQQTERAVLAIQLFLRGYWSLASEGAAASSDAGTAPSAASRP